MTNHMQAAIEAALPAWFESIMGESLTPTEVRLNLIHEQSRQEYTNALKTALDAALPHIRAMIAQEILDGTNTFIVPTGVRYNDFKIGHAAARQHAARIAKGPQQ